MYIRNIKKYLHIAICFLSLGVLAQSSRSDSLKKKETYYRKEEIVFDNKLYRVHNNYLTFGAGVMASSIRQNSQRGIGVDFQFPIKLTHFQIGVLMTGDDFTSRNTVQGHVCYGLRKEKNKSNIAAFIGPSFYTGVKSNAAGEAEFYEGVGGYLAVQAVAKLTYDIGIGVELFSEINAAQNMFGLKVIAFFSSAYRGPKRNYNPNVRAENPR